MKRKTILIAEDDPHIRQGLEDTLESEGFHVLSARNGREALNCARQEVLQLIILDVMMPELSGYDVCREIRRRDARTPIMMLTAKGQEIDKVVGLELGADDYLVKPFGVHELLARVAALIRRSEVGKVAAPALESLPETFEIGNARVDRKAYEIESEGSIHPLTDREMKLLAVFALHPGEVLSRNRLLDAVWGVDYLGTTRTLDQHVAQIRKKLGSAAEALETVHGVGYRYRVGS